MDPDRPQTVLVTGGAGFIGSALCQALSAAGHRIFVYDNLSRGRPEHLPPGVALIQGDIRDAAMMRQAVSAAMPDVVIHLAAMHFIPECIARPDDARRVNVEGTRRLLESCRESTVRSVVFASTAEVYAPQDAACEEDATPLGPLEVYGETKLEGEQLVRAFHDETGTTCTILRLFNAIGRNETNPHVLPHVFESLRSSDVVRLGNTAPRRDYIDTRDMADAIHAVMRSATGLQVVNIGTGVAYAVDDIINRLRAILKREITVVPEPGRMRASERMMLVAAIARLRALTGWTPKLTLDDTLRDLAAAYGLRSEHPSAS